MDVLIDNGLTNNRWLFERVNGLFNGLSSEAERISPPVDVVEEQDSYRFSVDLPGLKADSLDVKVEDSTLVINAERNENARTKDARVHRAERRWGRIHRAFRLPADVGHDSIKAAYKDGVLEIAIAKRPEAKAARVEVAYN
jgi:HSP20 family protein